MFKFTTRPGFKINTQKRELKIYKSFKRLHNALPRYPAKIDKKLDFILYRKSSRIWNPHKKLKLSIIKRVLNFGYGIIRIDENGIRHRTTPSAGALYPLFILYFNHKNGSLYKYNGLKLLKIKKLDPQNLNKVSKILRLSDIKNIDFKNASGFIFLFADLENIILKYGLRGYYFTLLEAGHVLQNLNIAAIRFNVGLCEIGLPINEEFLKKIFELNKKSIIFILHCVVGPL